MFPAFNSKVLVACHHVLIFKDAHQASKAGIGSLREAQTASLGIPVKSAGE
jgi:hypothetical protein